MKKFIALLLAVTSTFSMFAFSLSIEKEQKIQTATEAIMDYLLVQPREVANSVLLLLKSYQKQFANEEDAEKLYIVTSLLNQLSPFVVCVHAQGTWLVEAHECEFIPEATCTTMWGSFDECASSCRHSGSELCTLQCIPVCSMETETTPSYEVRENLRITVWPVQNTCLNVLNKPASCLLIRPVGQVGWSLMPEGINGFHRDPGFTYELEVLITTDGSYHYLNTLSKTVDLSVCRSYYDGCNTCTVTNGKLAWCTKKYCSQPEAPRCTDLISE